MSYKLIAPNYYSRLKAVNSVIGRGNSILNLGCGDGYFNPYLRKRFKKVIGVDINKADLMIASEINKSEGIKYEHYNGKKLPFKDNNFDEVVCVDVLEHIKNDKEILKEIYRVLKKKGYLTLTLPSKNYPFSYDPINYTLERLFKFHIPVGLWGFGHLRLYDLDETINNLKKLNFSDFKTKRMLHFFAGIFEQYYIVNLIQPLTKSNPLNKASFNLKRIEKLKQRASKQPPKFLIGLRGLLINIDYKLFKNSEKSLGILIRARKN